MNRKNSLGKFYLDDLSDCVDCRLASKTDDESDSSSITIRKRRPVPLIYSDSEDEDMNNNIEDYNDTWSTNDKSIILEPFEGSPGVKIVPRSSKSVMDIVNLFIGSDLIEHFVRESNRYHYQIVEKYRIVSKTKKWKDVTVTEMKKFLGLIILMGQVKKEVLYDYWSTDPSIKTPFFSKIMSRNRFLQIMQSWHFCNNNDISPNPHRLVKVQPVIDYFKEKFNNVYKPDQQLSLDECVIPWRGRLSIKTYNPTKITKYGILVRMLSEARTGYVSNFCVYAADGKKLEETVLSVIGPYKNMWHHIYQDNYYNNVNIANIYLKNKLRVCGTIRKNRGLPQILQTVKLSRGQHQFLRNGHILLQVWNNGKRNVNMITTIHSAQMAESGNRGRTSDCPIQKPISVIDYNKYMKGVDRADQYLSYYSIFRKTKKWTKRVVMFFINCALFNSYKVYTTLNGQKITYKNFLHKAALSLIEDCETEEQGEDLPNSEPTRTTSRFDHPGRLANFGKHKLVNIVTSGQCKKPLRQCRVCASKKKLSRTGFACKYCNVPLHKGDCFERYHSLEKY
ncbi:piggyBac transposable element-derived protein 4-like [Pseudomyrmex gracilis]|uniref:piggyBac transposable element-derived protein 4-like n=1 Tax=Pseudomyrmex gracilis TaxID=219809 RepID=UPI00099509F6|nr:piggyBac transposable element-derived protein 4-like [Pseudomyrmex gracilis]